MLSLLAQTTTLYTTDVDTSSGFWLFSGVWVFLWLVIGVAMIVAMWKIFEKAGQPGWKSIIPFYNYWTLCEIVGKPGWWSLSFLVLLIPVIGVLFGWILPLIVMVIVSLELGKAFGKDTMFSVLALIIFPVVGYLMLGFGEDKFTSPVSAGPAKPAGPASDK